MATDFYLIPKHKDKVLVECFERIIQEVNLEEGGINGRSYGNISFQYKPFLEERPDELNLIIKKSSELINVLTLSLKGFSITVYRGGKDGSKSAYTDEININSSDNQNNCLLSDLQKIDVISILDKKLNTFRSGRGTGHISKEQEELSSIHEATLSRLEELNEKLLSDTHTYRQRLDREYKDKLDEANLSLVEKDIKLSQSYEERLKSLNEKISDFEEKKKDLDDKSNTHARRQIRKDIISEIKNRQNKFQLTDGTNRLRRPVAWAMLALILFFVVLSINSLLSLTEILKTKDSTAIWISVIKQILYSFGAVGSLIFYIKWQNRWFEQHSQAEFHLKQLELDMERASWIVETSLEWNDAKGNTIPTELLESLSKNLFTEPGESEDYLVHPADQLASAIMGSSSNVKLKIGDSEVHVDPSKLRKSKESIPV